MARNCSLTIRLLLLGQLRKTSGSPLAAPCFAAYRHLSTANEAAAPGIRKLLVANRGEIACRVIATAQRLRVPTVAVYSDADRDALHVKLADEAVRVGPAAARDSYLRGDTILAAAKKLRVDAIHPGYGFLSENAVFAEQCEQQGVRFVGPPSAAIRAMGDKSRAKEIMSSANVPVVPGYHGEDQSIERLTAEAERIGYPLLVKAVAGGGGKGMRLAASAGEFAEALAAARREAASSFGNDRVLLERFVQRPRHVEVQVFADKHGGAVYLFDRDCSLQRRHQKVIEEAPAPGLSPELHTELGQAAVRAALAVGYVGAGTVEFLLEPASGEFFFMEMNTRLQVEHPVSEAVTGVDLVEWQLLVAAGGHLPRSQEDLVCKGHSVEVRLYAESPLNSFLPGAGKVRRWWPPRGALEFCWPEHHQGSATAPAASASAATGGLPGGDTQVRVDSGVREGDSVGTFYDPMIAKIITRGPDRHSALAALQQALAQTQVGGLPTNLSFLQRLASHPAFLSLELDTDFIPRHSTALLSVSPLPHHVAALAAVARVLLKVQEEAHSQAGLPGQLGPWGIPDGKRLWQQLTRTYSMEYPEASQQLAPAVTFLSNSHFRVDLGADADGNVTEVKSVELQGYKGGSGVLQAEVDGKLWRADVLTYHHGGEDILLLWLGGSSYELRWQVPVWSKDAKAHATHGNVLAPMPGRVIKVEVEEGQRVEAGQVLLKLEAMKMEHALTAPGGGRVAGLDVSPGSQVEDGQVLLRIEKEEEEA